MADYSLFRVFVSLRRRRSQRDQTVRTRVSPPDDAHHRGGRQALPPLARSATGYGTLCWHLQFDPLAVLPLEPGTCLYYEPYILARHLLIDWSEFNFVIIFITQLLWKVFANLRRRIPDQEGSLRRCERARHPGFKLSGRRQSIASELPHGKLPSMGSRRMDTGKSIAL